MILRMVWTVWLRLLLSFLALALYLGAASLLVPAYGNDGLWAAFFLFMAARAATLGWWYPRVESDAR